MKNIFTHVSTISRYYFTVFLLVKKGCQAIFKTKKYDILKLRFGLLRKHGNNT